jgi:hypothetical protein
MNKNPASVVPRVLRQILRTLAHKRFVSNGGYW